MNKEKIFATLGMPEDILKGVSHIEITGNSRMLIEGCSGVLLYTQDEIKLNLGKRAVSVKGDELSLCALADSAAQISGTIMEVSFS